MRFSLKRGLALLLVVLALLSCFAGCAPANAAEPSPVAAVTPSPVSTPEPEKAPKYVFLFIGDGMSYPQIQATADYLGALSDSGDGTMDGPNYLNFMDFPVAGSAVTYDSTSFCPDSASTATSIATGYKTYSGTINMSEDFSQQYETITEKLHNQKDFSIGVISTVNINHATPAAFYAHQQSRGSYYEIGLELIESNFEYFAGGGLLKPTGSDKDKPSLYDLASDAGYSVITTQAEAEKVGKNNEKVLVIDENLADSDAMVYEIDRTDDMWSLADYVQKGIEVLSPNENGFFMMIEGGKIDWACHANDAGSTIYDTIALADSVDVALEFAKSHPDETLILVTGDHETGGLTIGFAGTNYSTFLTNIDNQKISYAKYDSNYVSSYIEKKTPFVDVLKDIETLFGLKQSGEEGDTLVLTEYEVGLLKAAYDKTLSGTDVEGQAEYVMYGTYEPLSVTITHLLNNKSGIDFSSYSHTGLPVAVMASGEGQELFEGYYDNTQIYAKLAELLDIK